MKTRHLAFGLLLLLFASGSGLAQSAQALYQQGLGKQDLGEYENAIKVYERVVKEFPADRRFVALAKVKMIDCWLKLGDVKALDLINDVLKNYKDQPNAVADAKKLSELNKRVSRVTEKDVLVLSEFVNTTGDPMFDQGLRQALVSEIEQSPYLKSMDIAQVQQALQFLRRSPDERLTPQVARDVCVREQEKATLEGSIAKLVDTYVIVLEAVNCQTGERLAREQSTASTRDVLTALAQATTGIRVQLGESLSTIQNLEPSYAGRNRVTSSSLEAFQEFALGEAQFAKGSYLNAIPHYRRATELDPNFAMAFLLGGAAYGNAGDEVRRFEFLDRAYALLDHVTSERERLFIMANHYGRTGELNKQIETNEMRTRLFPRDASAHNGLGNNYKQKGDREKAEEKYKAAVREAPRWSLGYENLAALYLEMGRIEDARTLGDSAIALGADSPRLHETLLTVALRQNDGAAVDREAQWFAGKPEEYTVIPVLANRMLTLGQPQKARALVQRGQRLVAELGFEPIRRFLAGGNEVDVPFVSVQLRSVEAQIDAFRSGAYLRTPTPTALANNADIPPVLYAKGQALLADGRGQEAAEQFQKILNRSGDPMYRPFAYVGLARGAAIAGDTARARKAYEDFFELWKDAEQNVPILVEARKEYAALRAGQPVVLPPIVVARHAGAQRVDLAAPELLPDALKLASNLADQQPADSGLSSPGWSLDFVRAQCPILLERARAQLSSVAGQGIEVRFPLVRFIGLCGDTAAALQLVKEADEKLTTGQRVLLPHLRAMIEIGRNQPSKAVEMLEASAANEGADPLITRVPYLRAYAYTRAGMHSQAIAEYQKILNNKDLFRGPDYAANYVWLARAATLAGDTARAKRAYEDFFAIWKDSDPNAPLLLQARKEYEAL